MDIIKRAINKNNIYTLKPKKQETKNQPILKYLILIFSLVLLGVIIFFIAKQNQFLKTEEKIIIIEGQNSNEIAEYLADLYIKSKKIKKEYFYLVKDNYKQEFLDEVKNASQYNNYAFLSDKPKDASLEGYLYPDTYYIFKSSIPSEIIKKMLDNFNLKINQQIIDQAKTKNLSLYQVLTLASIVQKEVKTYEEMQKVAGVYFNRLVADKALESDSTITYITGENKTRASKKDLKIKSPYNTYTHKGLPPGPIGNPSLTAINAVLNPIESNYMFFITDENGKAIFSETGQEHVEKVEEHLNN